MVLLLKKMYMLESRKINEKDRRRNFSGEKKMTKMKMFPKEKHEILLNELYAGMRVRVYFNSFREHWIQFLKVRAFPSKKDIIDFAKGSRFSLLDIMYSNAQTIIKFFYNKGIKDFESISIPDFLPLISEELNVMNSGKHMPINFVVLETHQVTSPLPQKTQNKINELILNKHIRKLKEYFVNTEDDSIKIEISNYMFFLEENIRMLNCFLLVEKEYFPIVKLTPKEALFRMNVDLNVFNEYSALDPAIQMADWYAISPFTPRETESIIYETDSRIRTNIEVTYTKLSDDHYKHAFSDLCLSKWEVDDKTYFYKDPDLNENANISILFNAGVRTMVNQISRWMTLAKKLNYGENTNQTNLLFTFCTLIRTIEKYKIVLSYFYADIMSERSDSESWENEENNKMSIYYKPSLERISKLIALSSHEIESLLNIKKKLKANMDYYVSFEEENSKRNNVFKSTLKEEFISSINEYTFKPLSDYVNKNAAKLMTVNSLKYYAEVCDENTMFKIIKATQEDLSFEKLKSPCEPLALIIKDLNSRLALVKKDIEFLQRDFSSSFEEYRDEFNFLSRELININEMIYDLKNASNNTLDFSQELAEEIKKMQDRMQEIETNVVTKVIPKGNSLSKEAKEVISRMKKEARAEALSMNEEKDSNMRITFQKKWFFEQKWIVSQLNESPSYTKIKRERDAKPRYHLFILQKNIRAKFISDVKEAFASMGKILSIPKLNTSTQIQQDIGKSVSLQKRKQKILEEQSLNEEKTFVYNWVKEKKIKIDKSTVEKILFCREILIPIKTPLRENRDQPGPLINWNGFLHLFLAEKSMDFVDLLYQSLEEHFFNQIVDLFVRISNYVYLYNRIRANFHSGYAKLSIEQKENKWVKEVHNLFSLEASEYWDCSKILSSSKQIFWNKTSLSSSIKNDAGFLLTILHDMEFSYLSKIVPLDYPLFKLVFQLEDKFNKPLSIYRHRYIY